MFTKTLGRPIARNLTRDFSSENLYNRLIELHLEEKSGSFLNGPLWKKEDGKFYYSYKDKWIEKAVVDAEYDQGAVYTGTKMEHTILKHNLKYRNSIEAELSDDAGWVSREKDNIIFKRPHLPDLEVMAMSTKELVEFLGEKATDVVMEHRSQGQDQDRSR